MIVTIGRQYGSGGRDIGEALAKKLGYSFYDKEILTMAAENSGFSSDAMQNYDEKSSGSLIYSLYMTGAATSDTLPLNQQLAFAQFNVIRKVAQAGNCIIVGRCGDYVLRERKDVLTVFCHAPIEYRIARVMEEKKIDNKALAQKTIKKEDKSRSDYYNFFTHKKWGDASSAMLSIDTSILSIDEITDALAYLVNLMEKKRLAEKTAQ